MFKFSGYFSFSSKLCTISHCLLVIFFVKGNMRSVLFIYLLQVLLVLSLFHYIYNKKNCISSLFFCFILVFFCCCCFCWSFAVFLGSGQSHITHMSTLSQIFSKCYQCSHISLGHCHSVWDKQILITGVLLLYLKTFYGITKFFSSHSHGRLGVSRN